MINWGNLVRRRGLLLVSVCATSLSSASAFAQDANDTMRPEDRLASDSSTSADQEDFDDDAIVVTGTLLRGVAPTGTNVIGVTPAEIAATGATNANDLLATIPQVGSFNSPPLISAGTNAQSSNNRPRLRNIGSAFAGGSATLVLLDGHRVVGSGIRQTTPDPEIVPPAVIERVEVIPDGGSSTYGADAVAGVINFITRRSFSGLEAEARYGIGDDYESVDTFVTAGHDWGTGSAYVSYNYAWNDALLGGDRDYIQRLDWTTGLPADRNCDPGNITIRPASGGAITYALPDRIPDTLNKCDESDLTTFFPQRERHSIFVGLSQDFGDSVRFDLRGFFTHRLSRSNSGPFRTANASIRPQNPFYVDIPGATTSGSPQVVAFSWEPAFGPNAQVDETELTTWGITPSVSVDLSRNWQLRGLLNYGRSTTELNNAELNPALVNAALAATTTQTAINPYDIASTPNKKLLADIANWQFYGEAKQELINARAILDGTLFAIPGGDVRVAAGAEYIREEFRSRTGDIVPGAQDTLPFIDASRNVRVQTQSAS